MLGKEIIKPETFKIFSSKDLNFQTGRAYQETHVNTYILIKIPEFQGGILISLQTEEVVICKEKKKTKTFSIELLLYYIGIKKGIDHLRVQKKEKERNARIRNIKKGVLCWQQLLDKGL